MRTVKHAFAALDLVRRLRLSTIFTVHPSSFNGTSHAQSVVSDALRHAMSMGVREHRRPASRRREQVALTSREAASPPSRRKDDIKQPPPLLQHPLGDGMRMRIDARIFVEEVPKLGDLALDRLFASPALGARIDPVRPMTRDVSPYPVFLPIRPGERERARFGEEVVPEARVRYAKLQWRDEELDRCVPERAQGG